MNEGLIFCSFFLLSRGIVLPIPRPRDSSYLPKEERSQREGESSCEGEAFWKVQVSLVLSIGGAYSVSRGWPCLEDGAAGQAGIQLYSWSGYKPRDRARD